MSSTQARSDSRLLTSIDRMTLVEGFVHYVRTAGEVVALKDLDSTTQITWREYGERVSRLAAGLLSLGVQRGDTVGMMMTNRVEFHLLDTAALMLGAIPFSLYNTSSPEQIEHILTNAGSRVIFCEERYVTAVQEAGAACVEDIRVIDRNGTLESLESQGAATRNGPVDLEDLAGKVGPEDVATLIYTSGTTGPPKGVELTHANLIADWNSLVARLPMREYGRVLSYLPAAHLADRFCAQYASHLAGFTITCVPEPARLLEALIKVRPTTFSSTPRVWEKFHAALSAQARDDEAKRNAMAPDVDGTDGVAEVRAALLAQLGLDDLDWATSGSAPIAPSVLRAFAALGLPISEIWGSTEIGCVGTANPLDDVRFGTVGPVLPGIEAKVADDGELLIRGPNVMRGYRNDPEKTAEAIDADGWLHTGDIAQIDPDGYVRIIDRKNEMIITSSGKNISPVNIERALKSAGPMIGQACVIGDQRPYVTALVVLDPDGADGLDPTDPAARQRVADEVDVANATLSRPEQVKHFTLLADEWLPDGDELTPTMKLKRRSIATKYASVIEAMYSDGL